MSDEKPESEPANRLIANCWDVYLGSPPRDWMAIADRILGDGRAVANAYLRLKESIATHHGQKAEDRCIEDDDVLYAAAGLPPCDRRVGDKVAMLANCSRFIDRRCEGGGWRTYVELETALHANKCHPDFSYVVTPAGGMALFGKSPLESDFWERCPEAETVGSSDEVWRRKRSA